MNNREYLPIGTKLQQEKYCVERHLGSGGFGNTYLIRNTVFDELFAMKEFFWQDYNVRVGTEVGVSNPSKAADVRGQKEKFKKEAQRIRKLNHPNIVKIHDLFEENGTAYYVMDYIDGGSVEDKLEREGALTLSEALSIFNQILDALEVVHNAGITHMDIKPNNIMLDKQGNAYLIDFGASKLIEKKNGAETSTVVPYSAGYAPLEQKEGRLERIGRWTDIYALGATLYKMLTAKRPHNSEYLAQEGLEMLSFPSSVNSDIKELILRMMSIQSKRRPQSVQEVKQYLQQHSIQNSISQQNKITDKNRTKEKMEETIIESEKKSFSHDEETVIELNKKQTQPIKSLSITKPYVEVKPNKKLSVIKVRIYAFILFFIFILWTWGSLYISVLVCDYFGLGGILIVVLSLILMSLSTVLLYYPIDLSEYMDKKE